MPEDRRLTNLLESLRHELRPIEDAIRGHPYLEALEQGHVMDDDLRAFAGEQYAILQSDRRSFAHLASRFPEPPAGSFFLDLAVGEGEALAHLLAFAAALEWSEQSLRAYTPQAGSQAYKAFVAWLALNGSRSDVALAFLVNLPAWGASCNRAADALRDRVGSHAVAFFEFFSAPPPEFEQRALEVVSDGLRGGDSEESARRSSHLLQAYELLYWDTLSENLSRVGQRSG